MNESGLSTLGATIVMISNMMGSGVIFLSLSFKIMGDTIATILLFTIVLISLTTLYFLDYVTNDYYENSKVKTDQKVLMEMNPINVQDQGGKTETNIIINIPTDIKDQNTKEEGLSYGKVAAIKSKLCGFFGDNSIFFQGIGSCILYLVNLNIWINKLFPESFSMYITIGVISLLCFLSTQKKLSSIKPMSILSVFSVLYLMVLVIFYSLYKILFKDGEDFPDHKNLDQTNYTWLDYQTAIGQILFTLGCHENSVQVFSELKNLKLKIKKRASLFSTAFAALIYFIIGICGHYIGGDEINEEIISLFINENSTLYKFSHKEFGLAGDIFLKGSGYLFLAVLICSFAMQIHPAKNALMNLISRNKKVSNYIKKNEKKSDMMISLFLFACVVTVFLFLNVSPAFIVSLIGSTATSGITYIIPSILYIMVAKKMDTLKILAFIIAIFGTLTMCYMLFGSTFALTQAL